MGRIDSLILSRRPQVSVVESRKYYPSFSSCDRNALYTRLYAVIRRCLDFSLFVVERALVIRADNFLALSISRKVAFKTNPVSSLKFHGQSLSSYKRYVCFILYNNIKFDSSFRIRVSIDSTSYKPIYYQCFIKVLCIINVFSSPPSTLQCFDPCWS